ncbi:MAG: hypothetical protein L0K68_12275, partial [Tetragenococcus koreensis]|nr:hypothetical protein [Tetragenococcus koreensis]
ITFYNKSGVMGNFATEPKKGIESIMGNFKLNKKWSLSQILLFFTTFFIGLVVIDYFYGDPIELSKIFYQTLLTTGIFSLLGWIFGEKETKKGK